MRQKKFDSYGLAAFDIETFKENVDCVDGNTHPFMLSLYGKLYNYEKGEMVDVDEIFSGFDCSSQFVQYLIINNYFDVKMNANNCRNYIFAHNGGKFDFKFIIKHLFTMLPV